MDINLEMKYPMMFLIRPNNIFLKITLRHGGFCRR